MFDPKSREDVREICDIALATALSLAGDLRREDVFYVPIVIVAAVRHEGGRNSQVIGADCAVDDEQPTAGIVDVLKTVAKVMNNEVTTNVDHVVVERKMPRERQ